MVINRATSDPDGVQPFRAVARECAKDDISSWSHVSALLRSSDRRRPSRQRRHGYIGNGRDYGSTAGSKRATAELALSDEQRGHVYEGVMRILEASVAYEPAPAVADALPSAVPLQDLPAGFALEIPLVQGHKFVKFDDRIVVVDPKSRVVVAMIPRYKLLPLTWLASQPRVQRIVAK